MRKMILVLMFSVLGSIQVSYALVDHVQRNSVLRRIVIELNSALALSQRLEKPSRTYASRLQFHADRLKADLAKVKTGVEAVMRAPVIEPRRVRPISGDYLTFVGHKFP